MESYAPQKSLSDQSEGDFSYKCGPPAVFWTGTRIFSLF